MYTNVLIKIIIFVAERGIIEIIMGIILSIMGEFFEHCSKA